jgi:hypothetical protein
MIVGNFLIRLTPAYPAASSGISLFPKYLRVKDEGQPFPFDKGNDLVDDFTGRWSHLSLFCFKHPQCFCVDQFDAAFHEDLDSLVIVAEMENHDRLFR